MLNNIKQVITYIAFLLTSILCSTIPTSDVIDYAYSLSILNKLDYSFIEITNTPLSHDSFLNITQYVNSGELNSDVLMMIDDVKYNNSILNYDVNQNKIDIEKSEENYCFVSSPIYNNEKTEIKFLNLNYYFEYIPIQIATFKGIDNYYNHQKIIILPFEKEIYSNIQSKEYISFANSGDVLTESRFSLSKNSLTKKYLNNLILLIGIDIGVFLIIVFALFLLNKRYIFKTIKNNYLDGLSLKFIVKKITILLSPTLILMLIIPIFVTFKLINFYGYFILFFMLIPLFILLISTCFIFYLIYRSVRYEWFLYRCIYKNK